jgi:hypothetical protein
VRAGTSNVPWSIEISQVATSRNPTVTSTPPSTNQGFPYTFPKAVELERLCTLGTHLHAVASPVIDENDGGSGRCDGPALRLICPRL